MRKCAMLVLFQAVLLILATAGAALAHDDVRHLGTDESHTNAYVRRVLIVNKPELAEPTTQIVDPLLVNPWGTAIRPAGAGGHMWLANAGSATVTEYVGDVFDATGQFVPLDQDALKVVYVDGAPIGQVFSGSATDFEVTGAVCPDSDAPACPADSPEVTVPSRFIVSTEEGQIAAWGEVQGQTGPLRFRRFVTVVDNSQEGALYRGLAITDAAAGNWLYVANFAQDRIEIYDSRWRPVTSSVWNGHRFVRRFAKPRSVPDTYVPFAVHYLGGRVYVAYAELIQPGDPDYDPSDPFAERACPGCGYVVEFDTRGRHQRTFEGRRRLNAPWGMALAPSNFGKFSNALLVGNFGDGTIVGFDLSTGEQIGYLRDPQGERVVIDGLWALFFGNGASLGRADFLYFTAGPNEETDGVFGSLNWIVTPNPDPALRP
jgi:uncharacterized protein (TIGR03118 family)